MNGKRRAGWSGLLEGLMVVIVAIGLGLVLWVLCGCTSPFGDTYVVIGGHAQGAGDNAAMDVLSDQRGDDEMAGISTGTLENTFPAAPTEKVADVLKKIEPGKVPASQPAVAPATQPRE